MRREIKLKAAGMGVSGNYASGYQGLLLGDFNQIRILESTSKSGLAISPASPDRDSEVISSVTSPSVPVYFFVERLRAHKVLNYRALRENPSLL